MICMEHELQNRLHGIRPIYDAARSRPKAPWKFLDGIMANASSNVGRVITTDWCSRPAVEKTAVYKRSHDLLDKLKADLIRWRDMPDDELPRAAACPEPPPAPPTPPTKDEVAQSVFDRLHRNGVRLEIGSRGRISCRPARLLTLQDKSDLVSLKTEIAAIWKARNDVWVVE